MCSDKHYTNVITGIYIEQKITAQVIHSQLIIQIITKHNPLCFTNESFTFEYMKQLIENYKKPVPAKWRQIGDTALLMAIAIEPSINSMPLPDGPVKSWIGWAFSVALIIFKFWTNTKVAPIDEPNQ